MLVLGMSSYFAGDWGLPLYLFESFKIFRSERTLRINSSTVYMVGSILARESWGSFWFEACSP
jgi:hypothetical protein